MSFTIRRALALTTICAVLACFIPADALCAAGGARLEGLMVGIDGKPAAGYQVLLIGTDGNVLSRAGINDDDGMYRFRDLQAGTYALGIENAEGLAAPVRSEPAKLGNDELVRLDIKLMVPGQGIAPGFSADDNGGGLGVWWAGLTDKARIVTLVVMGVVVTTTTIILLDDDETPASPNGQD